MFVRVSAGKIFQIQIEAEKIRKNDTALFCCHPQNSTAKQHMAI
jgi:hypothetical protein